MGVFLEGLGYNSNCSLTTVVQFRFWEELISITNITTLSFYFFKPGRMTTFIFNQRKPGSKRHILLSHKNSGDYSVFRGLLHISELARHLTTVCIAVCNNPKV